MPKGIPKDTSSKRSLLHRFKIARGHLDKVIAMVENDEYCIDVINQSLAIQSALKSANQALLKNHLESCVTESKDQKSVKKMVSELIKVIGQKQTV
ncbi:metal-sensitive transcriptional regulator [Candidatus Microgenomates bacterium]|nr:MAG: metal-sensitive transcriptional regulator [Candidatus Microgenomates bacterium]